MQRVTRCMVLFGVVGALSAVSGCSSGDPTDNQGTPTAIVSNPEVVFVDQGASQPVVVSVVDEDGQPLEAEFTIGNVGAGITVTPDPDFLPVTGGNPLRRQARFFVQGVDLAASSFEVSALGLTDTIQVTSVPPSLASTFSNPAPALGDTITITAPVGTFFSQTSAIRFGIQNLVITNRAADGSVITFIPAPTIHGPLIVTGVKVTSNPALTFTLTTSETLVTDSLVDVAATFSSATPALGAPVTLTLPAGIRVIPTAVQPAPATPTTPANPGLTVAGAALAPLGISVAPDSGSITFTPAPNSDSVVVIPGIIAQRLPMYPLTVPTTTKITTPAIPNVAVTFSDNTPDIAQTITATAPAGFTFHPDSVGFTFGALAAVVETIAPDGSSATITPLPGSTGPATVTKLIVTAASQFRLTLPTVATVTVPAITPLSGTQFPQTAPTLAIPAVGGSTITHDAGTFGYHSTVADGDARLYKIVVTAPITLTVNLAWPTAQDLGVFYFNQDGVTVPAGGNTADAGGPGASPETSTSSLAPGTYLLAVVNFSATTPAFFTLTLSR